MIIPWDGSGRVVHVRGLPVHAVHRGVISAHTGDRAGAVQRERVRDGRDDGTSRRGLRDLLDLAETEIKRIEM